MASKRYRVMVHRSPLAFTDWTEELATDWYFVAVLYANWVCFEDTWAGATVQERK